MVIHRISQSLAFGKRLQILHGQLDSACDARLNVVTLLKIDVLKEIAADTSSGDGVAVHVYPSQLGNLTFHGHQSLAEVLVNAGVYLRRHHSRHSVLPPPFVAIRESTMSTAGLYGTLAHFVLTETNRHRQFSCFPTCPQHWRALRPSGSVSSPSRCHPQSICLRCPHRRAQ